MMETDPLKGMDYLFEILGIKKLPSLLEWQFGILRLNILHCKFNSLCQG